MIKSDFTLFSETNIKQTQGEHYPRPFWGIVKNGFITLGRTRIPTVITCFKDYWKTELISKTVFTKTYIK